MVTISDSTVLAIPIQENNEELVNLRDYPQLAIHPDNNTLGDQSLYVRRSVADKLIAAQARLSKHKLLVLEGVRPLAEQKQYFDEHYSDLQRLHPDWIAERTYNETSKYVSPPEITPPHSTGGAIDLTLCTLDLEPIDMGAPLNATPEESNEAVFTDATNLSDIAKQHRQLLSDALSTVGFVNYPYEYWHWSYGDRYWAYIAKQPAALYGSI